MERFLRAFRRSRDLVDVLAMSDADLSDLGVSRDHMMILNTLPDDVPSRVARMGAAQGLSASDLLADMDQWHMLLLACHKCGDLPACHRFMSREDTGTAADPTFCPNTPVFEAIAARAVAAE